MFMEGKHHLLQSMSLEMVDHTLQTHPSQLHLIMKSESENIHVNIDITTIGEDRVRW